MSNQSSQHQLLVAPGWYLLTAGVGGPEAKWRDKMLSRAIIAFQKLKEPDGQAAFSHAELLTDYLGETFAARWRTRRRSNGLCDYIGAHVMVVETPGMDTAAFLRAWQRADMDQFDGRVYPVWRILVQGISAFGPGFLTRIGLGPWAICSEVVTCFLSGAQYSCASVWRGATPAMLENWARWGACGFKIRFEGTLTEDIIAAAGLPVFKYVQATGKPAACSPA